MTISAALLDAYRYHRATRRVAAYIAFAHACSDVAAGKQRYPADHYSPVGKPDENGYRFVDNPARIGLREVGRVMSNTPRGNVWDTRGFSGWFTDPAGESLKDGSGLCYGVVYQLPGRNGKARYVAGYEFGGTDAGPVIDFQAVYEETCAEGNDSPQDHDAARNAAHVADSMARIAAEHEREYQSAWAAGQRYHDLGQEIASSRQAALREMSEFKAAKFALGDSGFEALCGAVRSSIAGHIEAIKEARAERAKLVEGDYVQTWLPGFWTGDKRLCAAFNEAACAEIL